MFRLLTIVIAVALVKSIQCSTIKRIGNFDAFQKIEAEDYSFVNYSTFCEGCAGDETPHLCGDELSKTVGYYSIDFGSGAVKVTFRLATNILTDVDYYFNLHLDTAESTPFSTYKLIMTGGACHWAVISWYVQTIPNGVHDLYFTFVNTVPGYGIDIDWFYFDATSGNQTTFDASDIIQAEDANYTEVAAPEVCPGSSVSFMGSLKADTVIAYYGVNFGPGTQMVQLRIAAWDQGSLFLHLDSALNAPFAYIPVQKFGPDVDTCNFNVIEQFVTTVPAGVHDLYFTVERPTGVESYVNIDWFTFKSTTTHNHNN